MAKRFTMAVAIAFLLLVPGTGSVFAHANLLKANIKNNQVFKVGHFPKQIIGTFAEDLVPKDSWMKVFEGVADHGLVTEKDHSTVNFKNPKQMILPVYEKLAPDKYYLIWYTHSAADGHWAAGILYFSVKK